MKNLWTKLELDVNFEMNHQMSDFDVSKTIEHLYYKETTFF